MICMSEYRVMSRLIQSLQYHQQSSLFRDRILLLRPLSFVSSHPSSFSVFVFAVWGNKFIRVSGLRSVLFTASSVSVDIVHHRPPLIRHFSSLSLFIIFCLFIDIHFFHYQTIKSETVTDQSIAAFEKITRSIPSFSRSFAHALSLCCS